MNSVGLGLDRVLYETAQRLDGFRGVGSLGPDLQARALRGAERGQGEEAVAADPLVTAHGYFHLRLELSRQAHETPRRTLSR